MGLKPATGLNTINNLIGLFKLDKFKIPIDAPVIKYMTKFFLLRELNIYFKNIRKFDETMSFDKIESLEESDLNRFCFERGIHFDEEHTLQQK